MEMDTAHIKHIIFDLGGVIIDIDAERTFEAFEKLSDHRISGRGKALDVHPVFAKYERGEIGTDDFLEQVREQCVEGTREIDVLNAWNAILLDIQPEKRELLLQLKEDYNTYLLSNTNQIHREWIDDYITAHFGDSGLHAWFHGVYTSYELRMQKPEPEIFKKVLRENDLDPTETLFLDDTEGHLTAAAGLGIKTIKVTETNTINDIFSHVD